MGEPSTAASAEWKNPFKSPARSNGRPSDSRLSTVVYRSEAVAEMSPPDLQELTRVSQARNGREAITGLMLYDNGSFFQWLEWPPDGVDRVMTSIHRDPRHTGIEVLNNQSVKARTFGDWTMKLAATGPAAHALRDDVIEPPRDIVEGLRKRPTAAPVLLTQLVGPGPADDETDELADADGTGRQKLNENTAALLKSVILSVVFPRMGIDGGAVGFSPPSVRAADLAELLISADQAAALELMRELQGRARSPGRLFTTLLEPAARSLGDMWSEDLCSDVDLTLALCRLQTAVRVLTADSHRLSPARRQLPVVLIVPEPGELHRLGAALDSSILGQAGWAPHSEFPADDQALQDLLAANWFDVLDLSLSVALRRDHWLPRVTETIILARHASRNPDIKVVVGGRAFFESNSAGTKVGADLASNSSGTIDRSITNTLSATTTISLQASVHAAATPC
jgi:methanogenic corrinoid protein MtbC1